MQILESELERYCKRKAEACGCLFLKIRQIRGWPDRVMILPGGVHWWFELKARHGRLSEMQKYACRRMMALGCNVSLIWKKEHFDDVLAKLGAVPLHDARRKVSFRTIRRRFMA